MDNELSSAVSITIELIVISAVIGIIMLFAGIGQQYQRSMVNSIADMEALAYGTELESLGEIGDPLPVASVYLVIDKNEALIASVSGTIAGTTITKKEDLEAFFAKKVTVTVTETVQKMYQIVVTGA